jgi:hypothetical protein
MKQIRKTYDEYEIVTNYGYGQEVELTESTFKEARLRVKEYQQNAQDLLTIRIVKRRIKKAV